MKNNQKPHITVLLALMLFFYLCSAASSLLFAKHWIATDCLNPTAQDYFRSLMLVALAMLDPHAGAGEGGRPIVRIPPPEEERSADTV